ncbi:unnamed protein product [Calypogeia fissa]
MVKPVLVPKAKRDTIAEREKLEAEEKAFQEAMKKKKEERKVETEVRLIPMTKPMKLKNMKLGKQEKLLG